MSKTAINVFKNDKLYSLDFTLQDSEGEALDLTNATLQLKAQRHGSDSLAFTGNMTVLVAASGTCRYTVADGDFDEDGLYYCEIVVTYNSGKVLTFSDFVVQSNSKLPI